MTDKPPDPTRWLSYEETARQVEKLLEERESQRVLAEYAMSEPNVATPPSRWAGITISLLLGFIAGYFTWGVWPSWPLIAKLFHDCYF